MSKFPEALLSSLLSKDKNRSTNQDPSSIFHQSILRSCWNCNARARMLVVKSVLARVVTTSPCLGLLVCVAFSLTARAADRKSNSSSSPSTLTFEQHIRPILKAHCFDCHGEGEKLKGGLDLRLRRLIVTGGESGPAIVPGNPDKSLLVDLITK